MRKKITKELFKQMLDTFYPQGYSGDIKKWSNEPFVGWFQIYPEYPSSVIMEINLEMQGRIITFCLDKFDDNLYTYSSITTYIQGIMRCMAPEMSCEDVFSEDNKIISYSFPISKDK